MEAHSQLVIFLRKFDETGAKLDSDTTTIQENRESLLKTLGELESMTEYPEKLHSDIVAMLQSVDANLVIIETSSSSCMTSAKRHMMQACT